MTENPNLTNKEQSDLDEKLYSKKNNTENLDGISSMSDQNNIKIKHIEWSSENEMIMVEWCDIAQCYKWLNNRANNYYSYMHAWFTIPAIALSTITGTASFAQTSLPIYYQKYAPMVIGTINIFIGILTTVQQYLKISELNEAHRVSAISWDKFARNIRIELSKSPSERMDAGHFIKISRQEFDRLMETSPAVSSKIIKDFEISFQGKPGSIERKRFEELKKPDICNIIVTANEYRHPWYLKNTSAIIEKIEEDEKEKKKKEFELQIQEATIKYKNEIKLIDDYVNKFKTIYNREPIDDEVLRHGEELVESNKIEGDTLKKYIKQMSKENIALEML